MSFIDEAFSNGLLYALGVETFPLTMLLLFAAAVLAYLLGSINCAVIISKALHHEDIRTLGSKNAGMSNMLRVYGKKEAALTLVGDVLKTLLAVGIGIFLGFNVTGGISVSAYVCGLFCMMGHIFPCFYGLRGGKGVLVAATMICCLTPHVFLMLLVIFVIMVAVTKYISVGSITAAFFYPLLVRYFVSPDIFSVSISLLVCIIIIIMHRSNISRLMNKEETKLDFKIFKHKDK